MLKKYKFLILATAGVVMIDYATTKNIEIYTAIMAGSLRYNLKPELIHAVIKAESGFSFNAVSPAGAQGLMQLMPETGMQMGLRDPFSPWQNIQAGCKYLAWVRDYLETTEIELILAGYNAGVGNVKKYGGVPPFPETVAYIEKVKRFINGHS